VRDGERTKDHEKTPRHPTKQSNQQQYSTCASTPAIIMHAGAGVLLIIMTNFASPKSKQ
jgi:hypothetical protein